MNTFIYKVNNLNKTFLAIHSHLNLIAIEYQFDLRNILVFDIKFHQNKNNKKIKTFQRLIQ